MPTHIDRFGELVETKRPLAVSNAAARDGSKRIIASLQAKCSTLEQRLQVSTSQGSPIRGSERLPISLSFSRSLTQALSLLLLRLPPCPSPDTTLTLAGAPG